MSFGRSLFSNGAERSSVSNLLNKVNSQLKGGKSGNIPAESKPSRGRTVEYYGDDDDDDAKVFYLN